MFASNSPMSLVRVSRFFICFSCILLSIRAIYVLMGIEKTMIATPTNAGQPKML